MPKVTGDTEAGQPSTALHDHNGLPHDTLAYGDRLKITFFESFGVMTSGKQVTTVFPRMDLSGDYTIDDSGSLDVARLGRVAVAGRSIPDLQSELAAAFKLTIGRNSDVQVAIIERQPVYVLGAVRMSGTFKHMPGMIVLQALAYAGGTDLAGGDASRAIETIRETERLRQTADKLDRLQVQQARLAAFRQGSATIDVPAGIRSRLSDTVQHDGLLAIVTGETATLIAERDSYRGQLSLAERQVSIARAEIEAQKMRADQLEALEAKKAGKLHELEQIAARGSVPQFKIMEANLDIAETAARREDQRVALVQAERRMIEAEIAQTKLELEHSVGIEKELAATAQEVADCSRAITSMHAVLQVLGGGNTDESRPSPDVINVTITRREPEGFVVLPASDTTPLAPGDVVQVRSSGRTHAPVPENAGERSLQAGG